MSSFSTLRGPVRIVIAEHIPLVRAGVRALVSYEPDMLVVGEACDGTSIVDAVARLTPDVAVLDFDMPEIRPSDLLADVTRLSPRTRALFLALDPSSHGTNGFGHAAAVLSKHATALELLSAIRRAARGDEVDPDSDVPPSSSQIRDFHDEHSAPPLIASLSRREREVFDLVVHGLSNEELSKRLFISVKTIETHRANINRKLNLHSTAGLVRYAARNGMLSMS